VNTGLGTTVEKIWVPLGALTVEAANDGPAFWEDGTDSVKLILRNGDPVDTQMGCDQAKNCGQPLGPTINPQGQTGVYMQDTRDFFTVHGSGRGAGANILMADGSVKTFYDVNGDGFLNPGFPVTLSDPDLASTVGYTDNTIELPSGEMFNGVFLFKLTKGVLETE
jgi:prepilin-type processing-associated H-X9-DG protein